MVHVKSRERMAASGASAGRGVFEGGRETSDRIRNRGRGGGDATESKVKEAVRATHISRQ